MAGDDEVSDGGTEEPGTAGNDIRDLDWSSRLMSVERFDADPEDDGADVFAVKFQVDGPDANAEVEIVVSDYEDEAEIVAVALDTLHRAMTAWGRLTENRRIAARDPIV